MRARSVAELRDTVYEFSQNCENPMSNRIKMI